MLSFCVDDPRVKEHFLCLETLHHICGILSTGAETPMLHIKVLERLIPKLHAKFVELYDHYKPKLHHMHHILDSMWWLGKCLSCFVTERRHKEVKDSSVNVYRYMEHTVVIDVVNKHCEQIASGHDLFEPAFLVEPRECKLQLDYRTSNKAVLECGGVCKKDIIWFHDMTCGEVIAFFIVSDVLFVEVRLLPPVDANDLSLRDCSQEGTCFKECRHIVDASIWHTIQVNIIRVVVPPILLTL
jgi:hypothetical protein